MANFFDKAFSVGNKAACLAGLHEWNEWLYANNFSCEIVRRCKREGCGKQEQRTHHAFGEWAFFVPNVCAQARVCGRCRAQESRQIEHAWTPYEYQTEDLCQQFRVCLRCREYEDGATVHVWNAWRYEREGSCAQVRDCRRCAAVEYDRSETGKIHE